MEVNNIIMNTKEQWFGFYKSLRDILRGNNCSNFSGMEAFNEINTLLILIFLEDKLDNFEIKNAEMCKFTYIYDLFYTKFDKRMKDEKMKEPLLSQLIRDNKRELFKYLFDKKRHMIACIGYDKDGNEIRYPKRKEEISGDLYFNHEPSVFLQILKTSKLNKLFIRTKTNDNDNIEDISTITGFIEDHADDVYDLIKKIADAFYIKDENGNLVSILKNNDLDFDALGGAYEKFMTEDTMNSKNTGEFFTRRDLIKFIVEQFGIDENDIVYDSSVGTGGFLLECIRLVKNKLLKDMKNGLIDQIEFQEKLDNFLANNIHGNEIKPNLYKSLMLNILMNDPKGLCLENLLCIDSMTINENDENNGNKTKSLNFSTISTGNPPYGGSLEKTPNNVKIRSVCDEEEYCDEEESKENYFSPIMTGKNIIKNSSGQFVMHLIRCLKNNGKAGFIIDRGILINGTDSKKSWNKSLRKFMIEKNNLTKIVMLPKVIFEHTDFATCVIFLTKGGKTSSVQFQELYFKDEDKGVGFKKFYEGNSWNVSFAQLKDKDYSLDPKDFNIPLLEYQKRGKSDEVVEIKSEMSSIHVEWKKIGDLFTIKSGNLLNKSKFVKGEYPVIGGGREYKGYHNEYNTDANNIFISRVGDAGFISYIETKCFCTDNCLKLTSITQNINKYIYYCLKILENDFKKLSGKNAQPNINQTTIKNIIIPVPSLENQQKIIDKLDTYFGEDSIYKFDLNTIMKYENGNRLLNYIFNEEWNKFLDCVQKAQRIDDLKSIKTNQLLTELGNRTIVKFNPDTKSKTKTNIEEYVIETFLKKEFDFISKDIMFESKKIKNFISFEIGKTPSTKEAHLYNGNIPWVQISDMKTKYINNTQKHISIQASNNFKNYADIGDLLFSFKLTIGKVSIAQSKLYCNEAIAIFKSNNNVHIEYLYYIFQILNFYDKASGNMSKGSLNKEKIKELEIPIPSLSDQQIIINYLDEKMEYHKTYWTMMSQMFSNDSFSSSDDLNTIEESNDLEDDVNVI